MIEYECLECGERLSYGELVMLKEPHTIDGRTCYLRYNVCPYCGSGDIDEVINDEFSDEEAEEISEWQTSILTR